MQKIASKYLRTSFKIDQSVRDHKFVILGNYYVFFGNFFGNFQGMFKRGKGPPAGLG